ncbi:hypothetical protein ACIBCS_27850 [Streptomyces phaeochromogenes]|uniref:hypothetical protein n=1 Tax=Streptomyces phaeochromogenes TaxID=1923 RepID=UPI0033D4A4A5
MSRKTVLYVAITAAAATAAFFGGGAISQSLNDDTSTGGCKAALQRDFEANQADARAGRDPQNEGTPSECAGVDNATLERYAGELIEKGLGESLEDAWSSPTPTP